jgi:hypothetical protein
MFAEVRNAILPVALRNPSSRGDLDRTVLLIESLAHHWLNTQPLRLLIVSPQRDLEVLRSRLPAFPNIEVSVRGEREFFPRFSRFYMMPGWYRQQIIKLQVPAMLRLGGYLTLDSDVCCVGDFDATTFVENGRALSGWEPKSHHDWWHHAAEFVGVPYDPVAHGLSVTPNILHSDLAGQALEFVGLSLGVIDSQTALSLRLLRRIGRIAWTEYSLYTSVAERKGNLFDYHVHWDPCYFQDKPVLSEYSSVWHARDFERQVKLGRGRNPRGKFIVVQSHAQIPMQQVREYCLSFDG